MKKEEAYLQIGAYEVKQDGTLCFVQTKTDKSGSPYLETTSIANHAPIVKRLKRLDNGIEISETIEISVRRAFKETVFQMTMDQLFSQYPHKAFGAACMVFLGRGFIGEYRQFVQVQCADMQSYTVYQHTGIKCIDGERVFLNGGFSVTRNGLTDQYCVELENQMENYSFTNKRTDDRYHVFRELFNIAPLSVILPCVVYCFQSAMNPLYREAGIEPSFLLYIIGKTGSRKTTLAKLLLNFFGHFEYATPSPAGFRDTANAIEKKYAVGDGIVLLIDDKVPYTNAYLKANADGVEQAALRLSGDKAPRAKMNADGTLKKAYRPKAGCIMTGEDGLQSVTESGIARAFTVELKPTDIDLDKLTYLQENADRLNQIMSEFIQFMLIHWDALREELYPAFSKLRQEAQSVGHGRLADAVAHLRLTLIIACSWLLSINEMTADQAHDLKEKAGTLFLSMAQEQQKRVIEDRPTKLYLDALKQMRETGAIRFVNAKRHDDTAHDGKIGYVDDRFFYLIPDAAYNAVCKFYREQDRRFPLSKTRIHEHLVLEGYVERGKSQITRNVRCCGLQGARLCLYKSALDDEGKEEE